MTTANNSVSGIDKPFYCQIYALMINSTLKKANGKFQIPHLTREQIDFNALGVLFNNLFSSNNDIMLRVADDYIDIATSLSLSNDKVYKYCDDCASILLQCADKNNDGVIELGDSFNKLRSQEARELIRKSNHMLPPDMIPFWVGSKQEAKIKSWFDGALEKIGTCSTPNFDKRQQGILPVQYLNGLNKIFNISLQPGVALVRMSKLVKKND
jgi:hypothetical protein